MKQLYVIYHSQSGSAAQLAEAVARGAASEDGVNVVVKRAMEACTDDLFAADAVIFGSPENFGYLSGGLKDFFDRSFYPALPRQLNLPYGVFISAGNDGSGAIRQLERILKGYPMKAVAEPVIVKGRPDEQGIEACETLGATLAAGLAFGIF